MVDETEILRKIKSKGFWEIEVRPSVYKKEHLSLLDCQEIIEKCQIRLRGWYYPHIAHHEYGEVFNGNNFVEGLVDSLKHLEVWRMYQSGQFIHYLNFWEDWIGYAPYGQTDNAIHTANNVKSILMTLYTVTEIFTFASRLASNKVFDNSLHISIKLKNINNRLLMFEDSFRTLYADYRSRINEMSIIRDVTVEDILANSANIAMGVTVEIFNKFNWLSKDIEIAIKEDQAKFLKGLI